MTQSPTHIENLVRLAISEEVHWVAGEHLSKTPVNWVTEYLERLEPGDLFILPGAEFTPKTRIQAKNKGAVGIVLVGEGANQLEDLEDDLPIIAVPDIHNVRTVQQLLLTILVNQRAALTERSTRVHAQLTQLAAEGEGMDGLAKAIASISGRGVLVQDKRGRALAEFPSSTLSTIWSDILTQIAPLESLPESMRDRKQAGNWSGIIKQELPGGLERWVRPIIVGQVARGYLSLVGLAGEMDILDQIVIEQGSLVCALEMSRHKAIREAEKRLKGNLLNALLQDDLSPRDAILWAQTMGLDLNQAHVALRFAWDSVSPPSRRRLETLVNGEVSRLGVRVIVSPMGAEVVCFCQVSRMSGRPTLAEDLSGAILLQAYTEYPDAPVRCGIGSPALDLTEWRASFRQAGQALEMARRLAELKPLYFSDLSVYRLLMQIEHNPELIAFQEETIGPILAHEGSDELIRTLEAYFQNNGNLSQTAEALYIHRNTLLYRMERIGEILHLDLDKPNARLAVQLALHIYRMMGSAQRSL